MGALSGQDKLVCGVDFSGAAKTPNDTWLAYGRLSGWQFEILGIKHVGSHAIGVELARLGLSAAGIDCPFSLPADFMDFLAQKALRKDFQSWQELAEHLVFTSFDDFLEQVKEFKKESKRIADKAVKAPALSPLHRGNPSMVQMTYHGMRMLASINRPNLPFCPSKMSAPVPAHSSKSILANFSDFSICPKLATKPKPRKKKRTSKRCAARSSMD